MFTITANGPNRVDIDFGGKIDREEMIAAISELLEKTKDIENGTMLYRIHDYQLPTLGGIAIEMSYFPELFQMIRKFTRAAVLCDQKWIQTISEFEGALFPGLDIKAFDFDEEEKADKWLAS